MRIQTPKKVTGKSQHLRKAKKCMNLKLQKSMHRKIQKKWKLYDYRHLFIYIYMHMSFPENIGHKTGNLWEHSTPNMKKLQAQ